MAVNIPESNLPRVVIVGGGFGGVAVARGLVGFRAQVVLIDRENHHVFQPLLYQVATAGLEPESIAFPIRKIFEGQENFVFRMAEVTSVNPDSKNIETTIGPIAYDFLVLATGSKNHFFKIPGAEDHGLGLKSVLDALRIRNRVLESMERALLVTDLAEREAYLGFVVVGGGPTGVEVAGALAELRKNVLPADFPELDFRRMRIELIEAGARLLSGMSVPASNHAREELERADVSVWLGAAMDSYDGHTVKTSTGKSLPTRNLIWTAGVAGTALRGLPPESIGPKGRIKVDLGLKVAACKNIFAIGDLAYCPEGEYKDGHPMVAPVALQQGAILARNLKASIAKGDSVFASFAYQDKGSMATIGSGRAVADLWGGSFKGFIAWMLWLGVHLILLMGFRNKLIVFVNWMWSFFSYDRAARVILRVKGAWPEDEKKREIEK
ncbi:MAG: NAD(P)/FAD-dependent oxidoreductase [Bdellovibrionota bacterium]